MTNYWKPNFYSRCVHCGEPAQGHKFTPTGGYWRLACQPVKPKAKPGRKPRNTEPQTDSTVSEGVKPFASFKPGVGVAYAWEPVVFYGGRKRSRERQTVRDWFAEGITLKRGFTGAKPARVIHWILEMLGAEQDDEVFDLFPGSGAVTEALEMWRRQPRLFA